MRLDIPAGTAVRFEPGEEKPVQLVELGGREHFIWIKWIDARVKQFQDKCRMSNDKLCRNGRRNQNEFYGT